MCPFLNLRYALSENRLAVYVSSCVRYMLTLSATLCTKWEWEYTGCNRKNGPDFGRVFLMLNYTEKTPKHLYPKLNGLGDNGQ